METRCASVRLWGVGLVGTIGVLAGSARASYVETFENGSDVGQWLAAFSVPRQFPTSGGNPDSYLQQGGFSTSVPNWSTASTNYQPGFNDQYKTDSVFVGDWTTAGVTQLGTDLNVLQAGAWDDIDGRPVTLRLLQMDDSGFGVNFEATYTTAFMLEPPTGWTHYDFTINAASGSIPDGWVFTHGDGTDGTDAEWATFLSKVDLVQLQYAAPGYFYPSFGSWTLGIDNVSITTVPTPGAAMVLVLGTVTSRRRRR